MKKVLFVCIENSCRSQIAEAFANIHSNRRVKAFSAGSKPAGKVNERAVVFMKEIGYDLSKHTSKSVDEFRNSEFDVLVTMGCGDECPFVPAKKRLDWQIPDPKNLPDEEFREIRDSIEQQVKKLIKMI
jgi:protein-tyrosine-phosphatase